MSSEPKQITGGFNVDWERSLSDYPASLYTLIYTLAPIAGGSVKTIIATASGEDHAVALTGADTAQYGSGAYQLTGYAQDIATSGLAVKTEVYVGRLSVLVGADSNEDRRTYAETTLESLKSTYAKLVTNSISQATVNGKTYTKRDMVDLRTEMTYWRNQIKNEQGGATKRIAVTFTTVS
jgi:hypothetical protein